MKYINLFMASFNLDINLFLMKKYSMINIMEKKLTFQLIIT